MADLQKFIEELRARVSIVDVVGAKVKLVRKGREYQACCPFHNEKTPSFTVNEAKGFYHCFGCGAHGDIVKFEMEANGLPFLDALKKLADKAGLPMPQLSHENHEKAEERKNLYEIMELAVKFFEKNLRLTGGRAALDYLYNRGFHDDIISKFRLGYAPNNNGLKAFLAGKGVSEHDMIQLGLAALSEKSNGRVFDFFRDRVIIPIFDKNNRPIAFGGRVMDGSQPKYLNSPETPIFNKRHVLYNLNNARDKAYEARKIIVCEGYMDVIALSKYGFEYAVAPLGTALTEDQIAEAWKICPVPTLCFDGDGAGIKAAIRSVDRALPILKAGYSLQYVFLPDKQDPDEFLKDKGHDAFEAYLENTTPLVDLLWRKNTENVPLQTPEQKALVEKNILDEVAKITNEQVRAYYLNDMRQRIYNELGRGSWKQSYAKKNYTPFEKKSYNFQKSPLQNLTIETVRPKINLNELVVKFVLAALIYCPELIPEYEEKISMFSMPNQDLQNLWNALCDAFESAEDAENLTSDKLQEMLIERQVSKIVSSLWELKMFLVQKPMINQLRREIDTKILEVQLKQLDDEIKECLVLIESAESFPDDVYERYQSLKNEKQTLLNGCQNAETAF